MVENHVPFELTPFRFSTNYLRQSAGMAPFLDGCGEARVQTGKRLSVKMEKTAESQLRQMLSLGFVSIRIRVISLLPRSSCFCLLV